MSKTENETYFTKTNLQLNFSVSGQDSIKYNLDNGTNTTITGNTTFNTTSGLHTLYLFANNSQGLTTKNVTFTINTTIFTIIYNNYSNNGSTTDFNSSTYEDLQNLSGIVLERSTHGKISFNEAINLTNDSDASDNTLDLDLYTNISSNLIEINTTALPNFNKSATLYLYGLTFTNPRVLRDGAVCSATICTEVNYSADVFIFNVTQFSNYSSEETPVETTTSSGGGGSGGIITAVGFTIDKNQISVSLNPGQIKTENITITNTGKQTLSFKIDNLFLDFVARGEDAFILDPGESKTIPLYILARIDKIPDLYLGKIIITSGSIKKEILIAVEVESKGALLDVRAEIEKSSKKVLPGGEILSEIRLFNLGGEGRKDIFVEYVIKGYDGNEIVRKTESLAIETQITFLKRIMIPKNAPLGNYALYVKATYDVKIASASDGFEIVSSMVTSKEKLYIVIIVILSIIISLIVYLAIVHQRTAHGKTPSRGVGEKIDLRKIMGR